MIWLRQSAQWRLLDLDIVARVGVLHFLCMLAVSQRPVVAPFDVALLCVSRHAPHCSLLQCKAASRIYLPSTALYHVR